ncbi:acyl transferase domain-containing protein [Immersiella caudata]|uniref:Acyl transferase domain-containing protein n=1 Tax=Immersiella caudata TaxID=314043 RepID=A0AA39WB34_9PEZI|nr:acyl transferase domain-containing protein [Immersiella caudata]
MGMRLPGGVRNAESYWDLLVNGRDGRCEVPKDRYNIDTWFGPGRVTHVGTKYAHFLENLNYANIDASFWSFTKQEAELLDPQQRLFLEVVYEAFESAGKTGWRGKDIGVYVGALGEDWSEMEAVDAQDLNPTRTYVYGDYIIANRASYEFDLKGPSMVVRTACSSSLMALHLACQDIHSGDCSDGAIVGGINIIISPRTTVALTEQGVLSEDGRCKTFDAGADGYARGEGVSAIYIKKLSDAIRDGDPIRAVIRSTCVAADGKTAGFTLPNDESHEKLMRRGHQLAGITDFSKTAMVECHGTGTSAGDPREVSAVARVFGEHGIYIGSVKPNIGHGEGASGLSSIMKMTLALEHKTIPPNINFKTPNPKIPWKEAKLTVPTKPLPWPEDRLERVSVNSFGIGGANAHVVLESAASWGVGRKTDTSASGEEDGVLKKQLLIFSAKHQKSLEGSAQKHEEYLTAHPESLADLAYTLNTKREVHPVRAFTVTDGLDSFQLSRVVKSASGPEPSLIFTFTGQGAQWARMGRELITSEGVFKKTIDKLDAVLAELPDAPKWTLRDEILAPKKTSRLAEAELSQPCCTAVQVALVDLLQSWGVKPSGVVGHSSGEIAAAYAAGSITAEDAIRIAYHRGQCTVALKETHKGGMAAIGLGRESVEQYLKPGVAIGCENSPSSVTLTGELDVLETVMEDIRAAEPSALVRALRVECAYHSQHMKFVADSYAARLGSIQAKTPQIPFYSSVTAKSNPDLSEGYWIQNLVSPVLFKSAVAAALEAHDNATFVEIGPHSALQGPIRQTIQAANKTAEYIGTLIRDVDALQAALNAAGNLWLAGVSRIDLHAVNGSPAGVKFLTNLPSYSWNYTELWLENRISKDFRLRKYDHHELLGSRIIESSDAGPAWRCKLRVQDAPWLSDHDILGDIIFPGAGYLAMAGEAVKQLRPGTDDFSLRRVTLSSALVLHGDPIELITTLVPVRLTTSIDSDWFTFTISSVNPTTNVWTKHITGQVRAGRDDAAVSETPEIEDFPRKVPTSSMYSVWRRFGLNYGGRFRGLDDITAHTTEQRAAGTIYQKCSPDEAAVYSLHPGSIDAAFHLSNVCLCHGLGRNFRTPSVPKYIEEMYVGTPDGPIRVVGDAEAKGRGGSNSNLTGVSNGKVVLNWKGLELSPLSDGSDVVDEDPHAAAVLEWKSDIDFMNPGSLLLSLNKDINHPVRKLVDTLGLACIVESHHQLAGLETDAWHLIKFRDWLGLITQQAVEGNYSYVANCAEIAALSSPDRIKLIEDSLEASYGTEAEPVAVSLWRIYKNSADFFSGEEDPLEVLMADNLLMRMYDFTNNADSVAFLKLLGHKKPVMRVLEIGAGTGGTTATILAALASDQGERLYGTYVHTDISSGFAIGAKERFKDFEAIEYRTLDITLDPEEQGFELGSFDLICSSNCLHATPNLVHTLKNVRKLLRPDGRLFLMELSPESSKSVNYVMGPLVGWWLSDDGRDHEPYVSADIWHERLLEAGFSGVEAWAFDGNTSNSIVARPAVTLPPTLTSVSVVAQDAANPTVAAAIDHLRSNGLEVETFALGANLPADRPGVFLLDLEAPFLASITEEQFNAFKHTLFSAPDMPVLYVTGACQIACADPRYALVNGISRSIRQETGLDFVTLELERFDTDGGWRGLSQILKTFPVRMAAARDQEERETDFESEYAFHDGTVQVGRMHWIKINDELKEKGDDVTTEQVKRLVIEKPGIIQTLKWRKAAAPVPRGGDWVRVDTRAVGLNFKDVLIAMGIVDSGSEGNGDFGFEGAGVITSVGPDVKWLSVGDRVAFSSTGCFATSLIMAEMACVKLPNMLSFEGAATMPCVYGTALYGLEDLARLEEGQTVLIHSACGGVGQAAIQISQMIGAEIFCTVGNEEKIEYLGQTFGIPRDHIFNSRDSSFLPGVLKATGGKGVDVVLNSLSGELLHESWKCVAKFGTMVEIGKRDFIGKAELSMDRFENNRTFVGLDHTELWAHKPKVASRVLRRVMLLCSEGKLAPITPIKTFESAKVEEAFRYMQKGQHIGKIVATVPKDTSDEVLNAVPARREIRLRGDRTYIFAGGLGGLGQSIATYLAELGARHLIFFSRSAGRFAETNPSFGKELESLGCHVQFIGGSINELADVEKVIASAITPIGGVLQAAMVLQDANFVDMTFQAWDTAVRPKVTGTWNFEEALKKQAEPLDFFFLFSSVSGTAGQIGQANYAAGNTFMDAYVQYRRAQGLACSTLAIGIMEDVGFLARERHLLEALRATSLHFLHEQDLLDAMELMLGPWAAAPLPPAQPAETGNRSIDIATRAYVNPGHVILGLRSKLPLLSPMNRTGWKKNPRLLVYRNIEQHDTTTVSGGPAGTDGSLKEFLSSCGKTPEILTSETTANFLANEIGATLFNFMMRGDEEPDLNVPLANVGVDSLVSIELRNWFRQKVGVPFTVVEIVGASSIADLGRMTAEKLAEKHKRT